MPNLEVECSFAGRWSLALSGMYSDFAYKDKTRDSWSVSEISLESRVWLSPSGRFTGLHTGVFAEYGDSMYVAVRSISLRTYFTAGRAVSGRRACRWGIVSP